MEGNEYIICDNHRKEAKAASPKVPSYLRSGLNRTVIQPTDKTFNISTRIT